MHVRTYGQGPRLVLVHGSVTNSVTWSPQRALSDRFMLVAPDRSGYPPNPPLARIDFQAQAREVGELLGDGAHLLGFSYGGVVSLLTATAYADRVRSLAVIEPPCFGVARGHPAVEETIAELERLWTSGVRNPAQFLTRFAASFGEHGGVPNTVAPRWEQGVRALMAERPPWEADIALGRLAAERFPKLVCSSGGHAAYEAVCDVLERALRAERVVLGGAGHAVHHAPGFNEVLTDFLERAEAAPRA